MPHVILIVEDDAFVLMLAESILREVGYETTLANTVTQAQTVIDSPGRVDLVFTDVQLGEDTQGGVTVGKLVGQTRSGTPVLYSSGCSTAESVHSGSADRSAFLSKPYTAQELTTAVSKLLQSA